MLIFIGKDLDRLSHHGKNKKNRFRCHVFHIQNTHPSCDTDSLALNRVL